VGPSTLESATLDTMLANDCQDLLFNYINNILVGGTPCLTYGTMMEKRHLYFVCLCIGCDTISITHFLQIIVKILMIICCEQGD
jgi:hypothetical protein